MIGFLLTPIRLVLTPIFALVIFLGFFGFLAANSVSDNVLSAEFYNKPLADNHVYARFYDKVLLDPEYRDTTDELLGDVDVPVEDIAAVGRRIMPPEYLRTQVEGIVAATVAYMKKDTDDLELLIDMTTPLENAKRELLAYVDTQVDEMELVPVSSQQELEEIIEGIFRDVEAGVIPAILPSMESFLTPAERLAAYDQVLEVLRADPSIPVEVTRALDEPATDRAIRVALETGDPRIAVKEASDGLAGPLIDDGLDRLRRELVILPGSPGGELVRCEDLPEGADLSSCTHYDVLQLAAEASEGSVVPGIGDIVRDVLPGGDGERHIKEDFLDDLDSARDGIELVDDFGRWAGILIMVVGSIFLGVIYLPRLSRFIFWPGLMLALSGLVFLVAGIVLNSVLPDRFDSLVEDGIERTDLPESVLLIATDVVGDMAAEAASGFIVPSIVVLVVGVLLVVTSRFVGRIPLMLLGGLKG